MSEEHMIRHVIDGKEFILIGTAHVSKTSAELVKRIIEEERPDSVCVELDKQRYQSIQDGSKWKDMDIFKVIKEKKATLLFINLALSSFQKRMANQFGINPGQEMIQGIESAEEVGAKLVLADRNIQTTFSRIWHYLDLKGKMLLLTQVIGGIFSKEGISEEELEKLKSQDMINFVLQEFTEHFPKLKKPLIDERDEYLAEKIRRAPGRKVVAVLGAAHVPGVLREIEKEHDLKKLSEVPPRSKKPRLFAWAIPVVIIGLILYTFLSNPSVGWQQTLSWLIWNGSLSAIGAAIAFAHPLAILTAFVAAPITSLNPFLAAGWFAGFVQAVVRKPSVGDFERISEDVTTVRGFWQNKVSRILLIVILANIGSSIGTFIGGADVVRLFFKNL